jgi:hypothetical protein
MIGGRALIQEPEGQLQTGESSLERQRIAVTFGEPFFEAGGSAGSLRQLPESWRSGEHLQECLQILAQGHFSPDEVLDFSPGAIFGHVTDFPFTL